MALRVPFDLTTKTLSIAAPVSLWFLSDFQIFPFDKYTNNINNSTIRLYTYNAKPISMARATSKQALITSLHISPGNCLKNCWTYPAQPHYSNYLQERTYKSVIMSHKNKMGMIRYLSMCCLYLLKSFWKVQILFLSSTC